MARTYTYETTISICGAELEAKFSYGVTFGYPATRDEPGTGSEVIDIELLEVEGRKSDFDRLIPDSVIRPMLVAVLEASERDLDSMVADAADWEVADEDDARERAWESVRDEGY